MTSLTYGKIRSIINFITSRRKIMKLKITGFLLVFALLVSACSGSDQGDIKPLEPIDRQAVESDSLNDGYQEVEVAAHESEPDAELDGETASTPDVASATTTSQDKKNNDSTKESDHNEKSEDTQMNGEQGTGELDQGLQSEYSVLDLSEPDNLKSYNTGLVFILQEDDLWRVVDRQGRIYRVTTSYDGVAAGMVNHNATVTLDEDGNPSVSLVRDYTKYDQPIILTTTKDEAATSFAQYLLKAQQDTTGLDHIDNYQINRVTVNKSLGKGIIEVEMNFDVMIHKVPADSHWKVDEQGNKLGISYTFTLYDYDENWILPLVEPLYKQLQVVDEASIDSEETSIDSEESSIDSDEEVLDPSNQGETSTSDQLEESRTLLAAYGKNQLEVVHTPLAQSSEMIDAGLVEYQGQLVINKGNEDTYLYEAVKYGDYQLITVYRSKVYLYNLATPPASEVVNTGLSVVDMETETYRTLYTGAVESGSLVGDKFFVFGNDNLFKLDLVNNSLQILTVLPKHLDFNLDLVSITDISNNMLTVKIVTDENEVNYAIDIITGELTTLE